jgi:mannitol-1-/sugar-/sorbitol-6-phosphatase
MAAWECGAEAVLFDCDGVLVDSRADAERAWSEWAAVLGLPVERVLEGLHGRRTEDTVRLHVPERRHDEAMALIEGLELRGAATTREIPGAAQLVARTVGRSAVVTSASPALLDARLLAAGIPPFAVTITAHDVLRGKPAPEPYLSAADRLGVDASRCVVIEDSPVGITAARAARVAAVIGIGAHAAGADIGVPDLTDVLWRDDVITIRSTT